jgi:hypothetical protein
MVVRSSKNILVRELIKPTNSDENLKSTGLPGKLLESNDTLLRKT